jgi:mono/diheme cytochrome c family protein
VILIEAVMWRRLRRVAWWVLGAIVTTAIGGGTYVYAAFPRVRPASRRVIERTQERIARGRYLVENVAVCVGCHSRRDFDHFGMPIVGRPGGGWGDARRGGLPMRIDGLPGDLYPRNITPDRATGIGAWTDGEIVRAIREGVSRDGTALFGLMPYEDYRRMSDEDVAAVVAYLRTMAPVRHHVPRSDVDFPYSMLMRLVPQPVGSVPEPDRDDPVQYGEYLAAIGGCIECHTPWIQGIRHEDRLMKGGNRFKTKEWTVYAPDLTTLPDDAERFVARFRQYRDMAQGRAPLRRARHANSVMPWLAFSEMKEEDLRAIWSWLRRL